MKFHVITLFPEMFEGPLTSSIIGRAADNGLIKIDFVNPRDFTKDRHRSVDAPPYGGGPGMVMTPQPLFHAVTSVNKRYSDNSRPHTMLMSPQGEPVNHQMVQELSRLSALTIVCGHYEGVDERFVEECIDQEVSVGDLVLTGGEIPAMAIIDAVARLLPGVLGDPESSRSETFSNSNSGMLEGPVYTRPVKFRGRRVPEVLLSGNRHEIERFRKRKAAERTLARRPELLHGWGPEPTDDD